MDHLPALVGASVSAGPPPVAGYNLTASRWSVSAPGNEELGGESMFINRK